MNRMNTTPATTVVKPSRSGRRRGRAAILIPTAAALAGLLAGCDGGSSASAPGGSAASTAIAASSGKPAAADVNWGAFQTWLQQRAEAGLFSGTVLVAQDGKPRFEQAYGMADRVAGVANTAETKYCIASIGKLFTAVAIARLVEEGKLSFKDTIGKYVPGFAPDVANRVTIADLLTMPAGLSNVALGANNPPPTLAGQMELIVKEPLQFNPGSRFLYSNDDYIVLGAVIERISGQSYDDYVRQHIFEPAGMTDTDVTVYKPGRVPGMAHGYMLVGANGQPLLSGSGPAPSNGQARLVDNANLVQIGNPSGGAYSTVGDLLKFAQALLSHKLLSPAMTNTILLPRVNAPQPGGPPVDKYTYGFAYQAINDVVFVGHNGGTPGYEGEIDIYPHNDDVVIILTNQDQVMVPAIRQSEALLAGSTTPTTVPLPSSTSTSFTPTSFTPTTSAPSTTTTTQGNSPADKAQQYVQCMRSHGEPNFPEPVNGYLTLDPSSGINPNSPKYQAAQLACRSFAPSGAPPGGAPGPGA